MTKEFKNYDEAYSLYSDILSGREPDRKNPWITHRFDGATPNGIFNVWWQKK
jgi:hypothetical protein